MMVGPVGGTPRRRGFGLVEMAVAGVLFATIVLITVQVVGWVASERAAVGRREAATRAAGNLMERILARPWADLSTESLAPLVRSLAGSQSIAPARLQVEVLAGPLLDGRGQKKVVVEVVWPERSRVNESPLRLVAWTFERKGNQP